jgi:hypothetical protein
MLKTKWRKVCHQPEDGLVSVGSPGKSVRGIYSASRVPSRTLSRTLEGLKRTQHRIIPVGAFQMKYCIKQQSDRQENGRHEPLCDPGAKEAVSSRPWKLIIGVILLACFIHAVLRIYGINNLSLERDEVFTWFFSRTMASAITDIVTDVHPPAYFLMMSGWQKIFGDSEIALRLPSVLFSLLTLVALSMYCGLVEVHERSKYIFFVLALFCFLPYEIYLARYARSYTMLMFLCTAFTYCYFRLSIYEEPRYLGWSVMLGTFSLYTNYLAGIFMTATIAAGLLCGSSRSRIVSLQMLLAIGVLCAPLLIILPLQTATAMALGQFGHFANHLSIQDLLTLISPYSRGYEYLSDLTLKDYVGFAFSGAAIGILAIQLRDLWALPLGRALLIQLALLVIFLTVSPVKVVHSKSICIFAAPVVILLAVALAKFRHPVSRTVSVVFIVGFVGLSLTNFPYHSGSADWRIIYSRLSSDVTKSLSSALLIDDGLELLPLQYYVHRGVIVHPPPIWVLCTKIVVILPCSGEKLKVKVVCDPGFRLENGKTVRSSRAFWWMICRIFSEKKDLSDIYFIRWGSGDLLSGINEQIGLPIKQMHRSGILSVYHIEAKNRIWCTLFDSEYYVRQRPEIAKDNQPPLREYLLFGGRDMANPHPCFDTAYYLEQYPDVAASGINPLLHFIEKGAKEKRNPHPCFDTAYYLEQYPDVAASGINPLVHFIEKGAKEKRNPHPSRECRDLLSGILNVKPSR